MSDVMKEKEQLLNASLDQEFNENKDKFVEVFVEGRKYFTHKGKNYYVMVANRRIEKEVFHFKRQRIRYWVSQGVPTISEIQRYCAKNREQFPQIYFILSKVEKVDEDGEKYIDYDHREASLEEHEVITKMLLEGKGVNTILKALKYDPEDHMLHVAAGQSEQIQLQDTAEVLAGVDEEEFLISKVLYDAETEQLVWNSLEELQEDITGLYDVAVENYKSLMMEADKKKLSN